MTWIIISIVALLFIPITVYAEHDESQQWFDLDWQFSKRITLDKDEIGFTQAAPFQNFTVLVNFTSTDLIGKAASDGSDIMFTNLQNNTQFDHDLDFFNSTDGNLKAWVRIPDFISNVFDYEFIMYYNDTGSNGPQEDKPNAWDDDFMLVTHYFNLADIDDSNVNVVRPSVNWNTNNPKINSTNTRINNGTQFDGSGDTFRVDESEFFASVGINMTYWTWKYSPFATFGNYDAHFAIGGDGGEIESENLIITVQETTDNQQPECPGTYRLFTSAEYDDGTNTTYMLAGCLKFDVWQFYMMTFEQTVFTASSNEILLRAYYNGTIIDASSPKTIHERSFTGTVADISLSETVVFASDWAGTTDEVRFYNATLPYEFSITEFCSQSSGCDLVSVGSEGSQPAVLQDEFPTILMRVNEPSATYLGGVHTNQCPENDAAVGIDSNGDLICQTFLKSFTVIKLADETIDNDNIYHYDEELKFQLFANHTYLVEATVFFDSDGAADLRLQWLATWCSECVGLQWRGEPTGAQTPGIIGANNFISGAGVGVHRMISFHGFIEAGSNVNTGGPQNDPSEMRFRWAQTTSHNSNTTVSAGSTLIVHDLGIILDLNRPRT